MRNKRNATLSAEEAREAIDALNACRTVLNRLSTNLTPTGEDYVTLSAPIEACYATSEQLCRRHGIDRYRHVSFLGRK
ncbi:hypothetical protein C8N35_11521 [Breoghania corrubedonensis]|uniref:Uncharacterized protein n=1 Tax=Breoghania corrubedonensis TaxID=665038 RepID=A0A2T5UR47_9HYPH|nr:hypothetical protein [Breoghania corrubedonensis]PTW53901.1 hypothetical protein C8N35_11521 [Breoghania corrubedonensis]